MKRQDTYMEGIGFHVSTFDCPIFLCRRNLEIPENFKKKHLHRTNSKSVHHSAKKEEKKHIYSCFHITKRFKSALVCIYAICTCPLLSDTVRFETLLQWLI